MTPAERLRDKLLEVHHRLCEEFGCPIAYFGDLDPLDELVSSLLSHRTRNRDSATAFRTLRERFPDWASVRDAPVEAVQAAISARTWPEAKAPALQRTLHAITERRGALDLQHLADLPVAEAREWLETLPGVGPKTSAAVLSFSTLRRRALPVDSHHHRVLEAMLPPEWDAQQVYDHHEVLMLHGQKTCHFRSPACGRCVLLDLCPTGQSRRAGPSPRMDDRPAPSP